MSDFSSFRAVYDELTDEASTARYQFVSDHLQRWFEHLDESSIVAPIIQKLQDGLRFGEWYEAARSTYGGEGASFNWPKGREKSLGMKLLFFRAIAEGAIDAAENGYLFVVQDSDLATTGQALMGHVFIPTARELRRYLEQAVQAAPASDRVVPLNHNQPEYKEVIDALGKLERALREANDYPEPDEKEQKIAEVSAAATLFRAPRISIEAVRGLLLKTLMYLTKTFATTGIGAAAKWAWTKIGELLPHVWF